MSDSIIKAKSFKFAIRIVNMYKHLIAEKKEYVLTKQILRSGTSIGANVSEAYGTSSNKDFKNKMTIALKEARETEYWLSLMHATEYLENEEFKSIYSDCNELIKILIAIIKNVRQ